jgi:hypothetical protein
MTHYLTTETADVMAGEVARLHELAEQRQGSVLNEAQSLFAIRRQCASIVEAAHANMGGARFLGWWNSHGLPVGWASRYLRISRTSDRKAIADKGQLRLMGVIPDVEIGEHEEFYRQSCRSTSNPLGWMNPFVKFKARFTDEVIDSFDDVQREIARREIEPLVKIYNKLSNPIDV